MPNYKVTKEVIQAAKELLGAADQRCINQVDSIVLRDMDPNADPEKLRKVVFIPIGAVLGIATYIENVRDGTAYKDEDIIFVSMKAFANIIGALGFYTAQGTALVAPRGDFEREEYDSNKSR